MWLTSYHPRSCGSTFPALVFSTGIQSAWHMFSWMTSTTLTAQALSLCTTRLMDLGQRYVVSENTCQHAGHTLSDQAYTCCKPQCSPKSLLSSTMCLVRAAEVQAAPDCMPCRLSFWLLIRLGLDVCGNCAACCDNQKPLEAKICLHDQRMMTVDQCMRR